MLALLAIQFAAPPATSWHRVAVVLIDRPLKAVILLVLAFVGVKLAHRVAGALSLNLVVGVLFGYARLARWRFRNSPKNLEAINEFIARRTKLDQQAAQHRLRLLSLTDPCPIAKTTRVPIYALAGLVDPIVPWIFVRHWLRKNCPALRAYRVIGKADHNVLGTASRVAAEQVVAWMEDAKTSPG